MWIYLSKYYILNRIRVSPLPRYIIVQRLRFRTIKHLRIPPVVPPSIPGNLGTVGSYENTIFTYGDRYLTFCKGSMPSFKRWIKRRICHDSTRQAKRKRHKA